MNKTENLFVDFTSFFFVASLYASVRLCCLGCFEYSEYALKCFFSSSLSCLLECLPSDDAFWGFVAFECLLSCLCYLLFLLVAFVYVWCCMIRLWRSFSEALCCLVYAWIFECFMNAPMMNSLSSEGLMLEARLVPFLVLWKAGQGRRFGLLIGTRFWAYAGFWCFCLSGLSFGASAGFLCRLLLVFGFMWQSEFYCRL